MLGHGQLLSSNLDKYNIASMSYDARTVYGETGKSETKNSPSVIAVSTYIRLASARGIAYKQRAISLRER
jgi:hypothetical protein